MCVCAEDLLQETNEPAYYNVNVRRKDVIVIFVHPLKNKLNRIIIWSNLSKK